MSIVKSFSVGNGDMFYINHNSDNFTIVDCCLPDDVKNVILNEIRIAATTKGVIRFISTHPDDDHIRGLAEFDSIFRLSNFYRVNNNAKKFDETEDFKRYKGLRDDPIKSFELRKGCSRRWMNISDEARKTSGLTCLWPIVDDESYRNALFAAERGESPNNISPAIKYSVAGYSFLWMGDMETDMQEVFGKKVVLEHTSVVFAPHHGRKSGHIPECVMNRLSPKLIIVGEAPSDELDYYSGYNTITQNTAGDILFETNGDKLDIFVSNENYSKADGMTITKNFWKHAGMHYLGSI